MYNNSETKIERILPDNYILELTDEVPSIKRGSYLVQQLYKIYNCKLDLEVRSRSIRRFNWVLFFIMIGLVAYMFHLKGDVQDLTYEYRQISSQIDDEKKEENILKAELAYLNSPARLQSLATQYLNLDNIKPNQFVVGSKGGKLTLAKFGELNNKKASSRWRYKKGNSNVRVASGTKGELKFNSRKENANGN
jgi:cell division protein FtsL